MVGRDPLQTMQKTRTGELLGFNQERSFKRAVFMGMNLVCEESFNKEQSVGSLTEGADLVLC